MKKTKGKFFMDFKMREKTLSFFGQNQYKDWRIMLSAFFIIFVLTLILSIFSYLSLKNETDIFTTESGTVATKKINKEVLTSMLIKMEVRQENFSNLKSSKPTVKDPSI